MEDGSVGVRAALVAPIRFGAGVSPWRPVAFLSGLGGHCSQEKGYHFVMLWR